MEKGETFICSHCTEEFAVSEQHEMGGELYCQNCIEELTFVCERCGERIWDDDNAGDSNIYLCQRCFDCHYCSCVECNRVMETGDACYPEDDDDPYCESCYTSMEKQQIIHDYGYKPNPIFYGEGNRYFGLELEIDYAGKDNCNAQKIVMAGNTFAEHIYVKSDGSLDDGMEIVTHPMSLDYHSNKMPWQDILKQAINLDYKSHKTDTCGLHIHVSRNCFGTDNEEQEHTIANVLYFVEHHWLELLRFSRRTEDQMKRWASRYGYKNSPQEILDTAKKGYSGRYTCVNIQNSDTVEFRMFRGTLKYNTLIATLQLVNEICNVAIFMADDKLKELSWFHFIERLNRGKSSELIKYLKERRLYLNDPVECEEDE